MNVTKSKDPQAGATKTSPPSSQESSSKPQTPEEMSQQPPSQQEPQQQQKKKQKKEHKLEHTWTFYFDRKWNQRRKDVAEDYESNLNKLGEFDTVEGFWRLYSWLKYPSEIPSNHNVYMFKGSAKPLWENLPKGGCWNIKVQKANGTVDRLWEELLFACIGGIYDEPTISGVVLSLRSKGDVISVWNSDNDHYIRIGEKLREIANLHPSTQMEYKQFQNALRDNSSKSHAQAYVFVPQPMTPIIAPVVPAVPVEPIAPAAAAAVDEGMAKKKDDATTALAKEAEEKEALQKVKAAPKEKADEEESSAAVKAE